MKECVGSRGDLFIYSLECYFFLFIFYITMQLEIYHQVSNIRPTLAGNLIVDHSDVIGASPVGAAPTTSSAFAEHLASIYCAKTTAGRDEKRLSFGIWCNLY